MIHTRPRSFVQLALFGVIHAANAQTGLENFSFAVTEKDGAPVAAASIKVLVEGIGVPIATKDGVNTFAAKRNFSELQVSLSAGAGFLNRELAVAPLGWVRPTPKTFVMARRQPPYTRQFLLGALALLDAVRIDAALAHLELAYDDPARRDSRGLDYYEAMLRYNYARALQQACLSNLYETCVEARNKLEAVLNEIETSPSGSAIYSKQGVTREMVRRAIADLESRRAKLSYQAMLSSVRDANYGGALAQLDSIEGEIAKSPAAYSANRVNLNLLKRDRAYVESLKGVER